MMRLAQSSHYAVNVVLAHQAAAFLHMVRGDWDKARELAERLIVVAPTASHVGLLPWGVTAYTRVLAELGQKGEALKSLGEAEQLLEQQAARGGGHGSETMLARAYLLLGRLDDAWRLSQRTVESYSCFPAMVVNALLVRGEIATCPERFDAEQAEADYRQALTLAEPRGMRPFAAHSHAGLARVYRGSGKRAQAQEHLTAAIGMYRDLDMQFWLSRAEADMRALA